MPEYWFYHLESAALEEVLPELLEKTLHKNWRALVKCPQPRVGELDKYLWTYKDDSFLPHGIDREPLADAQPILITSEANSSAGADCVFLIDGCEIEPETETARIIVMINGRNAKAVKAARAQWAELKKGGAEMSYWQQTDRGAWEKKA